MNFPRKLHITAKTIELDRVARAIPIDAQLYECLWPEVSGWPLEDDEVALGLAVTVTGDSKGEVWEASLAFNVDASTFELGSWEGKIPSEVVCAVDG